VFPLVPLVPKPEPAALTPGPAAPPAPIVIVPDAPEGKDVKEVR